MKTILTLLLFISSVSVYSQTGLVKSFDSQCNCTIVTNHYDNGQVSAQYHENDKGKKHGLESVFFDNGSLQYTRNWTNGKLNGEGKHYHRNGNVYYNEVYANGDKSGTWTFKDEEGDLTQTIQYTSNGNDGIYDYYHAGIKYFTQALQNGKMVAETVLNAEIHDQLKAEAEAAQQAGKQ